MRINSLSHDECVELLKITAEDIAKHAEEIIGNIPNVSNYNIDISIDVENTVLPTVDVSYDFLPSPEKIRNIYEKNILNNQS